MKRVTVILNDETYKELLDYAHSKSMQAVRRVGVGELIRLMVFSELKKRRTQQRLATKKKEAIPGPELPKMA